MTLDTNVVLRYLLGDIPAQQEPIRRLITVARQDSIVVPNTVFFELVWILGGSYYKFERLFIQQMLSAFLTIPKITGERQLLLLALERYVAFPAISFVDAALATEAELHDALPLISFDKKLVAALPHLVRLPAK